MYIVNLLELLLEIRYTDIANYGYNEVNPSVFKTSLYPSFTVFLIYICCSSDSTSNHIINYNSVE